MSATVLGPQSLLIETEVPETATKGVWEEVMLRRYGDIRTRYVAAAVFTALGVSCMFDGWIHLGAIIMVAKWVDAVSCLGGRHSSACFVVVAKMAVPYSFLQWMPSPYAPRITPLLSATLAV